MALVATLEQKREVDEFGFTVIERFLDEGEVRELSEAFDEVGARLRGRLGKGAHEYLSLRNAIIHHPAFLDLVDREDILSYVVDIVGWNVQNRDSVALWTPPQPGRHPSKLSLGWHFDYEEEFTGLTGEFPMPLLDFKVGWYVSDTREDGHATILFVPGSHRWPPARRARWRHDLDPGDIHELRVPPGSVLLWRGTLLHSASPNLSRTERRAIYISYAPRWLRPSGHVRQPAGLIERSGPVRRQLLGEIGDLTHPLGRDPENQPDSQHWFAHDWGTVPLKQWAEQRAGDPPYDWGTGHGAPTCKGPDYAFTENTDPRKTSAPAEAQQ